MSLTDKIPQFTIADITGHHCKVIQVYVDDIPYLRSTGGSDHPSMLRTLIRDFSEQAGIDIQGDIKDGADVFGGYSPNKGERYVLVGAGKLMGDAERKFVSFRDKSDTYNIGIDREHIEKIMSLLPDWEYKVF